MEDERILCFVKREAQPLFTLETMPRLAYVSRTLPSDRAYHSILHAHQDLAEVLLICGGAGRFLVGETFYSVKAGDLLIYNSGVVHDEFSSQENAISAYCAAIAGLRLPGLRENALTADGAPPLLRAGEEAEDLRLLLDMMYRYLREDRPGCEALCHHLMLALLGRVLQLTGDAPRRDRAETEPKALGRRVQAFIDGHFSEPLTLQDMGKALHVSPYYLSHAFKEASGYSPTQYLLRRRIGEAQNLLISTDLPMARIAEQVGFETQNYFNLQFSKHVGMPPGKYRESFVGKKKP
ncbi:MAG: AraC family transcriptional regulator [Oscillibacter sp.]|nr:AraC family transcriptional regulator [Oscillibacter sp.]